MKLSVKLLSIIIVLSSVIACNSNKEAQRQDIHVKTIKATYNNENSTNSFPFISQPYRTSELSFRVGGTVDIMDINPGNFYPKGSAIASIDPKDYQIVLDKAESTYEQAEAEYKRIDALFKLNNISESIYEKAKADYKSALAAYESAKNNVNYTRLTAPFNGYIQEVMFEQYQDVRASQPICSFIDVSKLKVELFVPQQVALNLTKNDNLSIRFDAMPEKTFKARVDEISKGATRNNLSFLVTAIIPNDNNELLAGMSGLATINNKTSENNKTIVVPQKVVRHTPSLGSYLWLAQDGKATMRKISTGKLANNGMIEIKEGVSDGDVIIATSIELLSDGEPISTGNE